MNIILIRHGKTYGNVMKRYIGVTDESLCAEGIEEIASRQYPRADVVFASPLKRCRETAGIIYGEDNVNVEEDLREMSFGIFENKSHEQLKENPYYIRWIESRGNEPIPGGESREEFSKRCVNAFNKCLENVSCDTAAFVVHGGTIMAVMSVLAEGDFFSNMVGNGQGFVCEYDGKRLDILKKLE